MIGKDSTGGFDFSRDKTQFRIQGDLGVTESKFKKFDSVRVQNETLDFNGVSGKVMQVDKSVDPVGYLVHPNSRMQPFWCDEDNLVLIPDFPPYVEREDRPAELKKTRTDDAQLLARKLIQRLHYPEVGVKDIYTVWFCSAVGNWKALVSTNIKDNCYYEVTHNGAKNETYVDLYIKSDHHTVRDEALDAMGLSDL